VADGRLRRGQYGGAVSAGTRGRGYEGPPAEIGVIGGSGLYAFVEDAVDVALDTPWGAPSDPLAIGEVAGRAVAFVARHGRGHGLSPHRINYRANLWALRAAGVRQVLAPSAVGSLRPELGPGSLVLPDQVVDRTWGRAHTYYDEVPPVHVPFADPYCPRGRAAAATVARGQGRPAVDDATLVVVNGPRFSSRAEAQWHAAQGWSVVGMTGQPEAGLARELGLCYTAIALVTDRDAGVDGAGAVTQEEVFRVFAENLDRVRDLLRDLVPALPQDDDCPCRHTMGVAGGPAGTG
jgi:5'-methylthioadenosine phosphorylase